MRARRAAARATWRPLVLAGLCASVVLGVLLGLGWGAVPISPPQVAAIVLDHLGLPRVAEFTSQQDAVLWGIRLPRVLLALAAGAALAVCGVALQAVLRNPLADPALLGVTGGATLGVVTLIAAAGLVARWWHPVAGAAGALVVVAWLHRMARGAGRHDTVMLLLGGVALQILLAAATTVVVAFARRPGLPDASFWTFGSLSGARWQDVWLLLPLTAIVALILWRLGPGLDLLLLGEAEARHLGEGTAATSLAVMALVAVAVGAVVAYCGSIAFVGLVVPHLLRTLLGPGHRTLVICSAVGGAGLVALGDVVARNLISPLELPIGILITLLGGPLFFHLVDRGRRAGAW